LKNTVIFDINLKLVDFLIVINTEKLAEFLLFTSKEDEK